MCSVINCSRTFPVTKDVHLFRFPKEYDRAAQWAEVCGLSHLLKNKMQFGFSMYVSSYRVCSRHFPDSAYFGTLRKRLRPDAVPVLLLNNEDKVTQHPLESASEDGKLAYQGVAIDNRSSGPEHLLESTSEDAKLVYDSVPIDNRSSGTEHSQESTSQDENLIPEGIAIQQTNVKCRDRCLPELTSECVQSKQSQTSKILSAHSPRKNAHRLKIDSLKKEMRRLKNQLEMERKKKVFPISELTDHDWERLLYERFSPAMATFIFEQYRLTNVRRYYDTFERAHSRISSILTNEGLSWNESRMESIPHVQEAPDK